MTPEQRDFADGVQAFNLRISGKANAGRSHDYYRGWTWAWGRSDALRNEFPVFPQDKDYADGYHNIKTELHHEHSTTPGNRSPGNLAVGASGILTD